jgi:intracellular multiplication protein IcmP
MRQQQQGQSDQTTNFFWVVALMAGILILAWWFLPQIFIKPVFWLRVKELSVIFLISHNIPWLGHFLHLPSAHEVVRMQQYMTSTHVHKLSFHDFSALNTYVGDMTRYVCILLVLSLTAFLYVCHGASHFRHVYTMKSLKKIGAENWPQIQPVINLDLVKADIDKGPWAMAQTPALFCHQHDLVFPIEKNYTKLWGLRKGSAYRVFSLQLGRLLTTVEAMPIHVKALLVVFIARSRHERDVASKYLSQVAASAASGKLDFTGVEEQLVIYQDSKALRWAAARHAYINTLMATMLEIARADGVLASAEFLWLKPVDRKLWYMLNSIGRQTAVTEVGGTFSHWLAEKKIGKPMKTPMVKGAVEALQSALDDILRIEDSERWHSSAG